MSLRLRLALVLVLTALPLMGGLVWLRGELQRRANEQVLRDIVVARMEGGGGREECEAAPKLFGGRDRAQVYARPPARRPRPRRLPLRLYAYDASFNSRNPQAFVFPAELRRALEDGRRVAVHSPPRARGGRMAAVRMEWDGPCAIVLARFPARMRPPRSRPWGTAVGIGAALSIFLVAVLVAVGPVVRRIRRLTAEVRRSAATHYKTPVTINGHDEISGLARAFNEAGQEVRAHLGRLEQRERTLRSFLANTTHDVMLPLTVLQGHLSSLRRQALEGGRVDERLLADALDEAHYMGSLVHNLGAAAKLEVGEPHVERHPVELNALVERVVGRHRPIAAQRAIGVEFAVPAEPVVVDGDVTLIEQALSNVVHNAVRYNRAAGHVAVLLSAAEGRFRLRVIDDGPGVSEAQLARLTERRFRGDGARGRQPNGLGLGLHIADSVARRHDFEMLLQRSEHGGLEVEFRGALAQVDPKPDPNPDSEPGREDGPRRASRA